MLNCYLDTIASARGFKDGLRYTSSGEEGGTVLYALEDLKHDFRIALGLLFCWNVAAGLAVPFNTDAAAHYDEYFSRICHAVHDLDIINYALVWVGGCQANAQKRLMQSGIHALRGGSPAWDVPPVLKVVPNDDLPHQKHGYETYKAEYRFLKEGLKYRLIHALKYRFMLRMTSSRAGHHGQKTTGSKTFEVIHYVSRKIVIPNNCFIVPDGDLEGHHPVDYAKGTPVEASAFDSYYISAFAPFTESSPSCALRICKRADDDRGEVWLIIKTAEGIFTWADHPATVCRVVYEGERSITATSLDGRSTMKFTCVQPMKAWKAAFRGQLRASSSGEMIDASFDLKWTRAMKTFSFGTDVSP